MSLVVPTGVKIIKIILLSMGFLFSIIDIIFTKKIKINRSIFMGYIFYMLIGLFYIFYGVIRNNPGALKVITVYFIWIFIYAILFSSISKIEYIKVIDRIFVLSSIIIPLYGYWYLLYTLNIISYFYFLDMYNSIGVYTGSIEISIGSVSSLLFILPYITLKVFLKKDNRLLASILILNMSFLFLTGRKALWLSYFISVFLFYIIYFFFIKTKNKIILKRIKRRSMLIINILFLSLIILILVLKIDLNKIYNDFLQGFEFNNIKNKSAYARKLQFNSLINEWKKKPLVGYGHGASAPVIRSKEQPWAYELSYVALLFQTGIIGFLIYIFSIFWIIYKLIKIINLNEKNLNLISPVLMGFISFIIGNATNPYLLKFDYLWIIFFPIALINLYSKEKANER